MAPHQATVNSQIKTCRDKSLNNVGMGEERGVGGLITAHDWFLYSLLKLEMHEIHSSQSNLKAEWNTLLVQREYFFFFLGDVMFPFELQFLHS